MIYRSDLFLGKNILVTGASSGIGKETAIMLGKLGANLVITGRNEERLSDVARQIGNNCTPIVADIGIPENIEKLFKDIPAEFLPLHGLFHAAGIEQIKPLAISKIDDVRKVFASSFDASVYLIKGFVGRGAVAFQRSIVIMSSVAGVRGQAGMSVYSGAKAAIDGLVRSAACELASKNIRVNSIIAGGVTTEMHEKISTRIGEQALSEYEKRHLLGFGKPEDVGNTAIYLLSEASTWITGTSVVVDGGYTCR